MNNGDAPKQKHRIGQILLITILVLICLGTFASMLDSSGSSPSTSTTKASPKQESPKLELLSYKCTSEYGYFIISGQVKNISNDSLKDVEAEGSTYTSDKQFVNSEDALIDYNPILAGQTSPFKVMMTINPAMKKCQVSFKELFGGTIPTKVSTTGQ